MAMIAITTSSSIKVKPRFRFMQGSSFGSAVISLISILPIARSLLHSTAGVGYDHKSAAIRVAFGLAAAAAGMPECRRQSAFRGPRAWRQVLFEPHPQPFSQRRERADGYPTPYLAPPRPAFGRGGRG